MFDPDKLPYQFGSDYLQTRRRHPRIVPPNFAFYCDWIFWDAENTYADTSITPKTIYVRSEPEPLNLFVSAFSEKIRSPVALVTSSHDLTMPLGFEREFGIPWRKLVENEFLKVWFTENRDLDHPKIKPLTLGLPSPDLPSWVIDSDKTESVWTPEFFDWAKSLTRREKSTKIFGCWYPREGHFSGTCPEGGDERSVALRHFHSRPEIFDWYSPGLARADYLEKMAAYQFVLCPHGGGLDPSPRCWEALIVKSIPIVKRNTMTEALQHLPVAVVEDWSEITPKQLHSWKVEFEPALDDDSLEHKMSNRYFFEQILNALKSTGT